MARMQTGYTYQDKKGRWYCRYDYKDENGKWRTIRRRAENKAKAKELLDNLLREFKERGQQAIDGDRMTFNDLASIYQDTYLIEPQYVDGRKVAGLRDWYNYRLMLTVLQSYFGDRKLKTISHSDLERFRIHRLKTPTRHGKQRSIAAVHRELSLLRRMLNVAKRNRWIPENPFDAGDSLIRPGDERPRERIITREEEIRLLAACTGYRAHLRPILICALDTGMRRGEILKLKWADIDFANRLIFVRAFNTKTMRARQVALTTRLSAELEQLQAQSKKAPDALVFGVVDNVKKAFNTARRMAGIPDVRFHDLRHTAASRLVQSQIALSEVGRVLGHTQPATTYRYVNANAETAHRAAAALDAFNGLAQEREGQTPLIN